MSDAVFTQAQLLVNKADKLDFLTLESKVNNMGAGEGGDSTALDALKTKVDTAVSDIAGLKTSVAERASTESLNATNAKVNALTESIDKKAETTALASTDSKATEAKTLATQVQSDLAALTEAVNGKASSAEVTALQTALSALTDRVAALETPSA